MNAAGRGAIRESSLPTGRSLGIGCHPALVVVTDINPDTTPTPAIRFHLSGYFDVLGSDPWPRQKWQIVQSYLNLRDSLP